MKQHTCFYISAGSYIRRKKTIQWILPPKYVWKTNCVGGVLLVESKEVFESNQKNSSCESAVDKGSKWKSRKQ